MSNSLDKINFKKQDPFGMIEDIEKFTELCNAANRLSADFSFPSYYVKAKKFVIVGMGGSGISGEIIKRMVSESNIILEVVHDYNIPKWADKDTVVIAISYSGNTEETLSAFNESYSIGCKLMAITSGGQLKSLAHKYKSPIFLFEYESKPRAAFPFMFIPLVNIFSKLGYLKLENFSKTIELLDQLQQKFKLSVETEKNPAKLLAEKIHGRIPIIYTSCILEGAGLRLKAQINEIAKNFAFVEVLPELDHNSIAGLKTPKNDSFVIMFESNFDSDRIVKRQNITAETLVKNDIPIERIKFVACDGELLETLGMVLFSDYVSYYLSILNGVDPSSNKNIDYLKKELAR